MEDENPWMVELYDGRLKFGVVQKTMHELTYIPGADKPTFAREMVTRFVWQCRIELPDGSFEHWLNSKGFVDKSKAESDLEETVALLEKKRFFRATAQIETMAHRRENVSHYSLPIMSKPGMPAYNYLVCR